MKKTSQQFIPDRSMDLILHDSDAKNHCQRNHLLVHLWAIHPSHQIHSINLIKQKVKLHKVQVQSVY